jgi:hypothetical protein
MKPAAVRMVAFHREGNADHPIAPAAKSSHATTALLRRGVAFAAVSTMQRMKAMKGSAVACVAGPSGPVLLLPLPTANQQQMPLPHPRASACIPVSFGLPFALPSHNGRLNAQPLCSSFVSRIIRSRLTPLRTDPTPQEAILDRSERTFFFLHPHHAALPARHADEQFQRDRQHVRARHIIVTASLLMRLLNGIRMQI